MRIQNFDERLERAKSNPDLEAALAAQGVTIRRVGTSSGMDEYRTTTRHGIPGDYSAVAFCKKPSGQWVVFDYKERTGRRSFDAIGCMTSLFGLSFADAVSALSGGGSMSRRAQASPTTVAPEQPTKRSDFVAPQPINAKYSKLFAYMLGRGISGELLQSLTSEKRIYESTFTSGSSGKAIPIAVFPICDRDKNIVGADSCSLYSFADYRFKHVFSGTDSRYAWCFSRGVDTITPETRFFYCESPIDAMSLYDLTRERGVYVSLCGLKDSTLEHMQRTYGGHAVICVDNDASGEAFRRRHTDIEAKIPAIGKDWNDELKARLSSGAAVNQAVETVTKTAVKL